MDNIEVQSRDKGFFIQKITGILQKYPIILQFLKFAAIGFLTTAVDILLLNLIAKFYGVHTGLRIGGVNIIAFTVALGHSYIWNANWAFSASKNLASFKVFWQCVLAGALGVFCISLAVLGGKNYAGLVYYFVILGMLILAEIVLWKMFGLAWFDKGYNVISNTILSFVVVSVCGALINSGIVALLTEYWRVTPNLDLNINIAKIFATAVSLFWNFVGYRLVVFKKKPGSNI